MEDNPKNHIILNRVHRILAHSYSIFFIFFLAGVALDLVFRIRIFQNPTVAPFGLMFLILGTFLILWAQKTSRNLKKENITLDTFCQGPYCYTRSPTHWGLFVLMLGFGLVADAFFVVLFTLISFLITKFTFIREQERALEEKYGSPYVQYKKTVKF
jgi:protein-S-isoprenylcysteine O-methyltransferase Ste14